MKIMYLHGFGSAYDPDGAKVKALETIGEVVGCDINYTKLSDPSKVLDSLRAQITPKIDLTTIDLFIGTSMGGWLASHLGEMYSVPFVALNPATDPAIGLEKYLGEGVDHTGHPFTLDRATIEHYPKFNTEGCGQIYLQEGDTVIDANKTHSELDKYYTIIKEAGGEHRFTNLNRYLDFIVEFQSRAEAVYGF